MDEKILSEAVENISLIKGVIDRTSKSFVAFSRIFIYWGILFILNSVVTLVMTMNEEFMIHIMTRYPVLNYALVGVIVLVAALIYRNISKKIPLVGLEKHLMKIWLLTLIMNAIPKRVEIIQTTATAIDMSSIIIKTNTFSMMIFSLAIALIATSLFTGYKKLMYLGVTYISISIVYAYFNLNVLDARLIEILQFMVLPFTFLYTGFFLKSQQARGN